MFQPMENRHNGDSGPLANGPESLFAALIVEDDAEVRTTLELALREHFTKVCCAQNASEAQSLAQQTRFELVVSSIDLPGPTDGLELARQLRALGRAELPVILLADQRDEGRQLDTGDSEPTEVLAKPVTPEQLRPSVQRAMQGRGAREKPTSRRCPSVRLIGESQVIAGIWETIHRVAPTPATILIKGETGTGKELVARALHELSGRRGAYVPVNCGAISPDLIEGEFFGHLKGAFTGAHQARSGLFGHAHDGTLFLDEIGEMPIALQAKLLRALEEKRYRPVGGNQEIPVNARVVAATNRDLANEVRAGRFRKDLYYRINVVDIRLPPLRERKNDISSLAGYFLDCLAAELKLPRPELDAAELGRLIGYHWPGNIRELRNVIERALLLGKPPSCFLADSDPLASAGKAEEQPPAAPQSLEDVQRAHILNALLAAGGNKTVAARTLGVSRKTIERKLKEWAKKSQACQAAHA